MTNMPFASIDDFRDIESLNHYAEAVARGEDPEHVLAALRAMSRDNARTPVQWDASPHAGFTTGTPWIAVNPNYPEINAAAQVDDPDSVFYALPPADRAAAHRAGGGARRLHDAAARRRRRLRVHPPVRRRCELLVLGNFSGEDVQRRRRRVGRRGARARQLPGRRGDRVRASGAREALRPRGRRRVAPTNGRSSRIGPQRGQAIAAGAASGTRSCRVPSASTAVGRRPARRSSRVMRTLVGGDGARQLAEARLDGGLGDPPHQRGAQPAALPGVVDEHAEVAPVPPRARGGSAGDQRQVGQADRAAAVGGQREHRAARRRADERRAAARASRRGVGLRNRARRDAGEQRACSAATSGASDGPASRSSTSEPSLQQQDRVASARGAAERAQGELGGQLQQRGGPRQLRRGERPARGRAAAAAAPTRRGCVCRSRAGGAAGSTSRACSSVATARGALPGSAATMRASASAVVAGSASSAASAGTSSVQGTPARRAAARSGRPGRSRGGTRTSSSSVTEPRRPARRRRAAR